MAYHTGNRLVGVIVGVVFLIIIFLFFARFYVPHENSKKKSHQKFKTQSDRKAEIRRRWSCDRRFAGSTMRGRLHVRVLQGRGLRLKHHHHHEGDGGESKPEELSTYVVVHFAGLEVRSHVAKSTAEPRWWGGNAMEDEGGEASTEGAHFAFPFHTTEGSIEIEVIDVCVVCSGCLCFVRRPRTARHYTAWRCLFASQGPTQVTGAETKATT